jgi:hypothetical protein
MNDSGSSLQSACCDDDDVVGGRCLAAFGFGFDWVPDASKWREDKIHS